jgi:hypothetical protein
LVRSCGRGGVVDLGPHPDPPPLICRPSSGGSSGR